MGPALLSVIRVLLLVLLLSIAKSCGSFLSVQSFKCTNNEKLCPIMTCKSDVSRNRVPTISCGCLLSRPMYNTTVDLKLQSIKSGRIETIVSGKENMCSIASRSVRGQVITRVFESIIKYFNVFKCPFQGNVTASNMPISLSFAEGFMPASDYRVLAEVKNAEELVLAAQLNFAIKKNKFLARN